MVNLCISIYLNCDIQSSLVIFATDNLCKASFTKDFQDFKSVVYLVSCLDNIVPFFVVTVFLPFRFATDSSLRDVPCIVDNVFTFFPKFDVLKFFLLIVCEHMLVDLKESLLLQRELYGCSLAEIRELAR